ncbi:MAG: uracil-DNA glycosylase family protein [Candidatus Heimdallarchaeaceae archaeon]
MKGFFTGSDLKSEDQTISKLSECGKCGLYKSAISPKMGVLGFGKHKILFVAEAPGNDEDRQGRYFVDDVGHLLRDILFDLDIDLDDCWTTDSVICKPPKNKVEPYMISSCRPNLLKTIDKLKPNVIIALGKAALESLMFREWKKNLGPINKWVGWNIPSPQYNAWVCPTYHPYFIMKEGENKLLIKIFKKHLKKAISLENKKIRKYSLDKLKSKVDIILEPKYAWERMANLSTKKGILAFDYETNGLKPDKKGHKIISVSFCLNGKDTFACMIDKKHHSVLSDILKNPNLKKVASNIKFEERWTRAILGHGVKGWVWDTMLAAHCLDNRSGISSIKFQSYIHLGISDYDSHIYPYLMSKNSNGFNRIEELDTKEMLMYNGLDSLLEYTIMKKQRKIFNDNSS